MKELPIALVEGTDGQRTIGMLYFETETQVVLLNTFSAAANLGGVLKSKVSKQTFPEANITLIPKTKIKQVTLKEDEKNN